MLTRIIPAVQPGTAARLPVRPALPKPPQYMTAYNRLAGPAGYSRFPTVGAGVAMDLLGNVTVGTGSLGPCAGFANNAALLIGEDTGYKITVPSGGPAVPFSVGCRVKPTSWNGGGFNTIVALQASGLGFPSWSLQSHGAANPRLDWTDLSGTGKTILKASGTLTTGAWHDYWFTFDGTTMKVWVDGLLEDSLATSGVLDQQGAATPGFLTPNPISLGGRLRYSDAATPIDQTYDGLIEGFCCLIGVALTGAEQLAIGAADPTVPPTGPTLMLGEPQAADVTNDVAGVGKARVSGWVDKAPATVAGVQVNWESPAGWSDSGATISGGTFVATVPLAVGGGRRRRTLGVRLTNNPSCGSRADGVGVGRVRLAAGQSNNKSPATNPQYCSPASHTGYDAVRLDADGVVRLMTEVGGHPFGYFADFASAAWPGNGGRAGSHWPLLAKLEMDRTGMPVKWVDAAVGNTLMADWARQSGGPSSPLFRYGQILWWFNLLPGTGAEKCVPYLDWLQGENDVGSGTNTTTYETALGAFCDNIFSDTGMKVIVHRIAQYGSSDLGAAIRAKQTSVGGSNSHAAPGADFFASGVPVTGDNIHMATDAAQAQIAVLKDGINAGLGY